MDKFGKNFSGDKYVKPKSEPDPIPDQPKSQNNQPQNQSSGESNFPKGVILFLVIVVVGVVVYTLQAERGSIGTESKINDSKSAKVNDSISDKSSVAEKAFEKPAPKYVNVYVTAGALNVRESAKMGSNVLGQLHRYDTVRVEEGALKDAHWAAINKDGLSGYVATKYLTKGDGRSARYAECRETVSRPKSGYVIERNGLGDHAVSVKNSDKSDAIVKLKNRSGKTVLSFFVRTGGETEVEGIPTGEYKLYFATGNNYSSECKIFLDNMKAVSGDTYDSYRTTYEYGSSYSTVYSYTLYQVVGGNMSTKNVPIGNF